MLSLLARWLLYPGPPEGVNSHTLQGRGDDPSQFTAATSPYGSMVIDPLPALQRKGLIVVSTLALVSLISSFGLLVFITYRFIFWKKYYHRYIGYNQYVVLIYNLALADFQQGLGFIVSLRWIATNSLHASDASCFLQGIWLQIGDPMSGMFVLAIALHTFMHVTLGRQLSHRAFVTVVICLWVFGVVLVVIPIGAYGRYIWVPSVAWVRSTFHLLQSIPLTNLVQSAGCPSSTQLSACGHTTSGSSPPNSLPWSCTPSCSSNFVVEFPNPKSSAPPTSTIFVVSTG